MKRTIVLIAVIILMLIAATPVLAQADGESGYPIPDPQPPACCYDLLGILVDSPDVCDFYYQMNPDELCQQCPDRCEAEPEPEPIPWWKRLVRIMFSIFE